MTADLRSEIAENEREIAKLRRALDRGRARMDPVGRARWIRDGYAFFIALGMAGAAAGGRMLAVADQREAMRIDDALHEARVYSLKSAERWCTNALGKSGTK